MSSSAGLHQRRRAPRAARGESESHQPLRPPRPGGRASRRAPRGSAGCRGTCRRSLAMNSSNCSCVCSPRASASSMALRSAIMSLTRCIAAGSGFSSACFMPRNWRVEHLAAQQVLDLLEGLRGPRASASRSRSSSRTARAVSRRQRVERGLARTARRRTGRGTARLAPGRPPCRAVDVPPRACRRDGRARAARGAARAPGAAGRRGRAAGRCPAASRSRSASRGDEPVEHVVAEPSSARRTS